MGILNLIKAVIVEDRDKWVVVCDDHERGQARQENTTLLSGPCQSEKLKLDDSIASLCVHEKTGTSLDKFPFSMVFLLKDKPKA